jgi:hypothetical protein
MTYGPTPVSYNVNYVHSWLEDTVFAQQRLLCQIVEFSDESDFGGAHSAFRLLIPCAVRQYGCMLRTLPHDIFRARILLLLCSAVRTDVFRSMGVSPD